MKKILLIFSAFQLNILADCPGQNLNLIPGVWLKSFTSNCGLQNAINVQELKAIDDEEQNDFIEEKMNKKIHILTKQTFEEIAGFEKLLWSMNIDLGKDNEEILNKCTLNKVSEIAKDCKSSKSKKRMEKLSKLFNSKDANGSLKEKMFNEFSKIRSIDFKSNQEKSCPIPEESASFVMKFQLDYNHLKEDFKGIEIFRKKFPQFMHLNEKDLQVFFEDLQNAKDFDSKKIILDHFLKSKDFRIKVAKGLGNACDKLFKHTLRTYICDDVELYPNTKNNFEKLYSEDLDNLSEDSSENKNNSVCRMERELKRSGVKDYKGSENSLDNLFKNFLNNRPEPSKNEEKILQGHLCDIYKCKNQEVAKSPSCQRGGPVSKLDLENYCSNKPFAGCSSLLSFVGNFEVEQMKIAESRSSSGKKADGVSSGKEGDKKEAGMSMFLENFLGVEGTLAAEGKKITPMAVAEKKQEFIEKGLDPEPKSDGKFFTASKAESAIADGGDKGFRPNQVMAKAQVSQGIDAVGASQFQYHDELTDTMAESQKRFFAEKKEASRKVADKAPSKVDISGVRKEMEDMLASLKGSDKEKMQTVADFNSQFMPKGSVPVVEGSRGLNTKESERYEAYRKRLEEWEAKLRAREFDLSSRDNRLSVAGSGRSDEADSAKTLRNENQGREGQASDGGGSRGSSGGALLVRTQEAGGSQGALKKDGAKGLLKGEDSSEAIVSSDDLKSLNLSDLKELGIAIDSSFIIKIKHQNKMFEVPVKSFQHKGKEILVPILSEKNKELSTIILVSPLFKGYKEFQEERALERESFDKMIL